MRYIAIMATLAMAPAGTPAVAQTKAAAAAPTPSAGTCSALMAAYENTSKELAANFTSGVADNSAPRATLRAMEDANALATAQIALSLMRDNHCALPKQAPAAAWYISAALTCSTDRLKASGTESPATCDRTNWMRAGN